MKEDTPSSNTVVQEVIPVVHVDLEEESCLAIPVQGYAIETNDLEMLPAAAVSAMDVPSSSEPTMAVAQIISPSSSSLPQAVLWEAPPQRGPLQRRQTVPLPPPPPQRQQQSTTPPQRQHSQSDFYANFVKQQTTKASSFSYMMDYCESIMDEVTDQTGCRGVTSETMFGVFLGALIVVMLFAKIGSLATVAWVLLAALALMEMRDVMRRRQHSKSGNSNFCGCDSRSNCLERWQSAGLPSHAAAPLLSTTSTVRREYAPPRVPPLHVTGAVGPATFACHQTEEVVVTIL